MAGFPVRPPVGEHERWLDKTMEYFFFADAFGWTPQQVDSVPVVYRDRLPVIAAARKEARAAAQADGARQARMGGR